MSDPPIEPFEVPSCKGAVLFLHSRRDSLRPNHDALPGLASTSTGDRSRGAARGAR